MINETFRILNELAAQITEQIPRTTINEQTIPPGFPAVNLRPVESQRGEEDKSLVGFELTAEVYTQGVTSLEQTAQVIERLVLGLVPGRTLPMLLYVEAGRVDYERPEQLETQVQYAAIQISGMFQEVIR